MPLILKMYYLPFKGLKTLCEKLITSYELKKKIITNETQRKSYGTYKRNDYNATYYFLRNVNYSVIELSSIDYVIFITPQGCSSPILLPLQVTQIHL